MIFFSFQKLLKFDASKRILAQDALQHKYFGDNSSDGYSIDSPSISTVLNNSVDSGIIDV